jgi:glycerol-3-phosphate acyltransferase PlsY
MSGAELALRFIAVIVSAYLLGSIPSGVLVGKLFDADPREVGSGKTGLTNVLRSMGPRAAAMVFVLDFLKGAVAVLLARFLWFPAAILPLVGPLTPSGMAVTSHWQATAEALAGITVILGHTFSVFIDFKGGRGVLTGGAVVVVISPIGALAGLAVFLGTIFVTRYVSLGSILGILTVALAQIILYVTGHAQLPHLIFVVVGAVAIVAMHHDNINRLLNGTERKLGDNTSPQPNVSPS